MPAELRTWEKRNFLLQFRRTEKEDRASPQRQLRVPSETNKESREMKKLFTLLFTAVLAVSLTAVAQEAGTADKKETPNTEAKAKKKAAKKAKKGQKKEEKKAE